MNKIGEIPSELNSRTIEKELRTLKKNSIF